MTIFSKRIKGFTNKCLLFLSVIATATLTFTSCGDDDNHPWNQPNAGGNTGGNAGGSSNNTANTQITSRMETPRVLNDGTTLLISHDVSINGKKVNNYMLEYDITKYHSRWVAFRFDGDTRKQYTGRSDEPFTDDPSLSSTYHIGSRGFGRGYDRGHLCASADRVYSTTANEQTFYMTNMSPQKSSFNQGYWVTLEGLVQQCGRNASFADTLYVVKGGTIKNDQIINYITRSNGKKVAVPKYYYMALLKVKNNAYSSIGFWMEHKEYGYDYKNKAPLSEIAKHAVTVNKLEELTGMDFFPNLPDAAEEKIESRCNPTEWGAK